MKFMPLARFAFALVAFLLVLTPGTVSRDAFATRPSFMRFRDLAEINGALAVIRGELGPAEFFKGLHSVERSDQFVVLNDQGEVAFFPDRVTITLRIMGPYPKPHETAAPTPIFDLQYMQGLQFKAEWKRGLEPRPVKQFKILTVPASHVSCDPPQFGFLFPNLALRESWLYEFVVEDNEVPIDDHLVLYVISPDNKRLARLSAHL
jgi:hypothetical protein